MKKILLVVALIPSLLFGQKISDLPAASTLGGTEVGAFLQSGTAKKTSVNQIYAYVNGLLSSTYATPASVTAAIAASKGKIYYTSVAGAVSDADLSLGSITFGTDNTTVIQTLLSISGPKTIVVDGKYSVGELFINSDTRIVAMPNCGMILRNHTSRPMFTNVNSVAGLNAQGVDANIEIIGGIWNGNGYNTGTNGSDLFDVAAGGSAVNGSAQLREEFLRFWGVDNLIIRDAKLYGARTYALNTVNNRYVTVNNVSVDFGQVSTRDGYNYDGLHFTSAQYVNIRDVDFTNVKDDNIAFNTTEANPGTYRNMFDLFVDNVTFKGGAYGIRVSSTATNTIGRVNIQNLHGTTKDYVVIMDNFLGGGTGTATAGMVTISNVDVSVTSSPDQSEQCYMYLDGIIDRLILKDITRYDYSQAYPYIKFGASTAIRNLTINGFRMRNTGTASATPQILMSQGTVNFMELTNVYTDNTNQTTSAILSMTGGTLSTLRLNGVVANNITNIVNHSGGTLSEIIATNVKHTATSSPVSFVTSGTIAYLNLSNYHGTTKTSGIFTTTEGDAYGVGVTDGDKGDILVSSSGSVWAYDGIVPIAKGGTGTGTTPSIIAGTSMSVTGSWPNQTVNYIGGGGGGATAFTGLSDVPSSYSGQGLKLVRVNSGATALEFVTASGTGDVVGPSSAVDGKPVVFDGTTGKLIKAGATAYIDWSTSASVQNLTTPTTNVVRYYDDGVRIHIYGKFANATNVATTSPITFTLPVAPNSALGASGGIYPCWITSASTRATGMVLISGGSTTATIYPDAALNTWTLNNTRQASFQFTYEK